MRISILAWGSLVNKQRDLKFIPPFLPNGPNLKIEFSRKSDDGRLTLVIDEANGTSCVCHCAESKCPTLDEALLNLWQREGSGTGKPPKNMCSSGRVGYVDLNAKTHSIKAMKRHPKSVAVIEGWARAQRFDAVIWTALEPNFSGEHGAPFTVCHALNYLAGLTGKTRDCAFTYIRDAPETVKTPLREAFDKTHPKTI